MRALKQAAQKEFLGTLGVYASFAEQLRKVMPRDAIWVRDVTQSNTTWGNRIFPIYSPQQNVYPVGAGIGPGAAAWHRRGGGGHGPQDRGDDRRRRLLPECRTSCGPRCRRSWT